MKKMLFSLVLLLTVSLVQAQTTQTSEEVNKNGEEFFHNNNYAEAVKWYRKSAEQGNAVAQYNLGNCYYDGNGVPQSYEGAVKWLRKAAEQGVADAKEELDMMGEDY